MFRSARRARFALTVLVAVMLTACGGGGGDGGLRQVNVGYIADYNGAALLAIADEHGLWRNAGLEPTYQVFTNGPLSIQALGAGDVDVAYVGAGATWLPAQGKAEIWAINSASKADRIVARPGVASMADLKGRKVGVPTGTSGDMLLGLALTEAGLSREDIEIVPMDPSTIVSAFSAGQIDAAGIWHPLVDTIRKSVPDLVELASNEDFMPKWTFPSSFVAPKGLAAEDPELAEAVISVLKQANDHRYENPDETVRLTAEFLGVGEEQIRPQQEVAVLFTTEQLETWSNDGTIETWLTGMQELFVDMGTLPGVVDPATFYTADTFASAKSGGAA